MSLQWPPPLPIHAHTKAFPEGETRKWGNLWERSSWNWKSKQEIEEGCGKEEGVARKGVAYCRRGLVSCLWSGELLLIWLVFKRKMTLQSLYIVQLRCKLMRPGCKLIIWDQNSSSQPILQETSLWREVHIDSSVKHCTYQQKHFASHYTHYSFPGTD